MEAANAERKVLQDPYNAIVFHAGRHMDVYLVGGYIRDLLSDRESSDRDYVVRGTIEPLVEAVASHTGGKPIKIGGEGLRRVVVKGRGTLDFSPLRQSIAEDLALRDFTINAIGWSLREGWIDPEGGMADLTQSLIRMVRAENLRSDPLRILRAYRLAAELSFKIVGETKSAICTISNLVSTVKSERITSEFFKILNHYAAPITIEEILSDGLLAYLINRPVADLRDRVKVLHDLYERTAGGMFKYSLNPEQRFSQNLTYRGLLGLEVLLDGLPAHLFRLSSRVSRRLLRLEKTVEITRETVADTINRDRLFDLFEAARDASVDFLLTRNLQAYETDLTEFVGICQKGVLSAVEVRSALQSNSGRDLGKAIRALRRAEFLGDVKNRDSAVSFLKAWEQGRR